MIYSIVILFIFALIILVKKITSKRSMMIMMMVLFLDIAIFASVIYISKCGNYPYLNRDFFKLDYMGFLFIARLKISYYSVLRLLNIGFGGFLVFMPFVVPESMKTKKQKITAYVSLIIPLLYVIYFDPSVRIKICMRLYSLSQEKIEFYKNILRTTSILCVLMLVVYMVVPIIKMCIMTQKSRLALKRRQLISVIISLGLLDCFCVFLFLHNAIGQIINDFSVESLLGFSATQITFTDSGYYIWFPVLVLIMMCIILLALTKMNGLDDFDFFRNFFITRRAYHSTVNMKSIFHSYKNMMFTVKILVEQLEYETNREKQTEIIKRLKEISENNIEQMNRVLEIYKNPRCHIAEVDVTKVIEQVVLCINMDDNIEIHWEKKNEIYAICDEYILREIIKNVIDNAIDAIFVAKRQKGLINICISEEYEWVIIKIIDNGTGISKKDTYKIFKEFYTTKGTNRNWGIGMHYVVKNMKAMKGYIDIKSRLGEGTSVNLMLQRGENKKWKK